MTQNRPMSNPNQQARSAQASTGESSSTPADSVLLTVAAVARRLGVAPATLRTWDRRYAIGPSEHDAGKNRLYSLTDVARLDFMRNLVLQGLTPAKAAQIAITKNFEPAKLNPVALPDLVSSETELPDNVVSLDSPKNVVRGLLRAANMLDTATCSQIVGNLIETKGVLWTWDNVLVSVLQTIGEKWEQSGEGIDVEHLIVDAIESQLRVVTTSLTEPINARPIILACTAHELHSLPLQAIAAGLAEHKISCRVLGARLPNESLVAASKKIGPSAILVWSQTRGTAEPELWEQIVQQRPAPVLVAAGPGWVGHQFPDVHMPNTFTDTLLTLATAAGRN